MKKLTRDRVVPIISARLSWLVLGTTLSGTPSLPRVGKHKKNARASLLAGIEEFGQPSPPRIGCEIAQSVAGCCACPRAHSHCAAFHRDDQWCIQAHRSDSTSNPSVHGGWVRRLRKPGFSDGKEQQRGNPTRAGMLIPVTRPNCREETRRQGPLKEVGRRQFYGVGVGTHTAGRTPSWLFN
jgi:hypothetical protein